MKISWKQFLPARGLWGQALLFLFCCFAMVLAFSIAPDTSPSKLSQIHSYTQPNPVIHGRSRKTISSIQAASKIASQAQLARLHRSRQAYGVHLIAESAPTFDFKSGLEAQPWSPIGINLALSTASRLVFTPPICA